MPIYVLKSNTIPQMQSSLTSIFSLEIDPREAALRETEDAIGAVLVVVRSRWSCRRRTPTSGGSSTRWPSGRTSCRARAAASRIGGSGCTRTRRAAPGGDREWLRRRARDAGRRPVVDAPVAHRPVRPRLRPVPGDGPAAAPVGPRGRFAMMPLQSAPDSDDPSIRTAAAESPLESALHVVAADGSRLSPAGMPRWRSSASCPAAGCWTRGATSRRSAGSSGPATTRSPVTATRSGGRCGSKGPACDVPSSLD